MQWKSLIALRYRSYWRRVWIQQEVYLARRRSYHCGDRRLAGFEFEETIEAVGAWLAVEEIRNLMQASPAYGLVSKIGYSFYDPGYLVHWQGNVALHDLEASESPDFVYGLLGVGRDCQNGEIMPDYSMSVQQLYVETMVFYFSHAAVYHVLDIPRRLAEKTGVSTNENIRPILDKHWPVSVSSDNQSPEEKEKAQDIGTRQSRDKIARFFMLGLKD
ncbi:hypothetical protein G6011_02534 [Alternaria panax]|uniref:Heterokaryon incompatibility domain-containing protein n=1 Tax=Alternaria panax TaxID=48097 RepID=A0AAD4F9S5_9PLEO|nr:hypothetical protein G6011_02534 [Alternaria panax]